MKKRVLSMIITGILAFTLLPVSAFAEEQPMESPVVVETPVPTETVTPPLEPMVSPQPTAVTEATPTPQQMLLAPPIKQTNEQLEPTVSAEPAVLEVKLKDIPKSGAKFVLRTADSAGTIVAEWTTDAAGSIQIDYAENGVYVLEQTQAPAYYEPGAETKWQLEVKDLPIATVADEGSEPAGTQKVIVIMPLDSSGQPVSEGQVSSQDGKPFYVENRRLLGKLKVSVETAFVKDGVTVEAADWVVTDDAVYEISVQVTDDVGALYGGSGFTDGAAVLQLKAGESAELLDIPCGYRYTISQQPDQAAFVGSISAETGTVEKETIVTVTNTYTYQTHNTGLLVNWTDANDAEKKLTGELKLYSDDKCTNEVQALTVNESGLYASGSLAEGTYYLKETVTPEGYFSCTSDPILITAAAEEIVVNGVMYHHMVITAQGLESVPVENGNIDETHSDQIYLLKSTPIRKITVSVNVKWDVPEGYTDIPTSVSVQLYRKDVNYATVYGKAVTLNAENGWKHSWSGNGVTDAYGWSIEQTGLPEGYTSKVITEDGESFTIVNSLDYELVTVSASVSWLNPKDYDKQPTSVKLTLYRDGAAYESVTVGESNGWNHRWKNLPDCFEWTVDEPTVPENYKKKITHVGNAWVIVNAHEEIPLTGDENKLLLWSAATMGAAAVFGISLFSLLRKRKTEK